jgi:thymidylate kinase
MNQYRQVTTIRQSDQNANSSANLDIMLENTIPSELSTLNLIYRLCKALEEEQITYCHWKSNAALDRSASGDNDLDLLVSRADGQRFTEILYRLGFKKAQVPPETQMPGVLDYYGYDREADKLIHVHAHYQLILGDHMTKNYRLPIEEVYLASAVQDVLFRVPTPEFEFIVFVIRMVLKHSTWDTILGRQGTLSLTEQQELEYLQARVDLRQIYDILEQHLPFLGVALFDNCIRSLQPNCPIWTRIKVGQWLQSGLRAHARRAQIQDASLKLWRRMVRAIRWRIFGGLPGKRLASGGAIIAIIGGDGAGKTTAVDELYVWLSKEFETIKVHMGKPVWSWTTLIVRGILKIGALLGLSSPMKSPSGYILDPESPVFPGYPLLLRVVCTARDRYLTYIKARRFAINGGLVICDRFPLPQVKLMDGLLVEQMIEIGQSNWLLKLLTALEKKYYQQIMLPELLIILKVNPEIAVQRKTDEDATSVRIRSTEIWELNWQQTPVHVINAGRSKIEVLSELKHLIWSAL